MDIDGGYFLEEYPVRPSAAVLDGALFGILGLFDGLRAGIVEPETIERCLCGVNSRLKRWDFLGMWSTYGDFGYLSPPVYHSLNVALLSVVCSLAKRYKINGWQSAAKIVKRWKPREGLLFRMRYAALFWLVKRARILRRLVNG